MSIVQALADKHEAGELVHAALKDIPESCCGESELEVYDMDRYAHSLGGVIPATMDGAWAGELRGKDYVVFIEMKSITKTIREFHFGKCAEEHRGRDPEETVSRCQAEFKAFVDQKISGWDFKAKMNGTQDLLNGMDAGLPSDLQSGAVAERCFIACDLSSRDFLTYRDTFKDALERLKSKEWGVPMAVPCSKLNNEQTLRDLA